MKISLLSLFIILTSNLWAKSKDLHCQITIVGGGVGGLYTAYELSKTVMSPQSICLFEAKEKVGGRINDISWSGRPGLFGQGARRVQPSHPTVMQLVKELDLKVQYQPFVDDLVVIGSQIFVGPSKTEEEMYERLLKGPMSTEAKRFDTFSTLLHAAFGETGWQYLRDVSRFRAEFEAPVDAGSMMSYLKREFQNILPNGYVEGGMSQFPLGMLKKIQEKGVQVFMQEPMRSIERLGSTYLLKSDHYNVKSDEVVLALNPLGLNKLQGDIVQDITQQKIFQEIFPIPVAIVTQWWPKAFWRESKLHPRTRRAWSTNHCVSHVEIPVDEYGEKLLATRSVFNDELKCVNFWKQLYQSGGIPAVEAEIGQHLPEYFPDVEIPSPLHTEITFWEGAWFWPKGPSSYSNEDRMNWAANPLIGEKIHLVSEAYAQDFDGWSEGAYQSAKRTIPLLNPVN